jgi:hypothetical protein
MNYGWLIVGLAAALPVSFAGGARAADEPVALVEDVMGSPIGIESMDYLAAGRVLRFKGKEGAVVSYLASCVRERIVGGTATIGSEHSKVAGGMVERDKVPCDGGRLRLSTEQAAKSGVVVFRAPPKPNQSGSAATIDRTLYGLSPVVDLSGGGRLKIERIDQPGERIEIELPATQLMRGTFYDFAKAGKSLAPGGIYRASALERTITFRVDPDAKPGLAPIPGRLLRF